MTVPHTQGRHETMSLSEQVFWSEATAAKACAVSIVTFRKWCRLGVIQKVELPGNLRRNLYAREDVEALAKRLAARSS